MASSDFDLVDRFAIDDTKPEGVDLDTVQRLADLVQHRRVELGFRKVLALAFVHNAVVSRITRRIDDLLTRLFALARRTSRQPRFEVEQSLLVLLTCGSLRQPE